MAWNETLHADADALADAVAAALVDALDTALATRGRATLALAGGRTAPPVIRRLAAQPRDWRAVHIAPSDERWVAADHADCNLRQLRESFAGIDGIHWLPLVPPAPAGAPDAAYANATLAAVPGEFDAVLLGMGADGHFASLFPGAPTLARALALNNADAAAPILPDPLPAAGPHPRVSLTLARLLRSRRVLLAITGADKRAVLQRAQRDGAASALPVAALLHSPATIAIHWSP